MSGKPAARMGDMAMDCADPVDAPTVSVIAAATCVKTDAGDYFSVTFKGQRSPFQAFVRSESEEADPSEGHFLDVAFVDEGNKSIAGPGYYLKDADSEESNGFLSDGLVQRRQESAGNADIELKAIVEAKWKATELEVGAKVELEVKTSGLEDGLLAVFEIWERDIERADKKIAVLVEDLQGDAATATWTYPAPPDDEEPVMTSAGQLDENYSVQTTILSCKPEG